MEVVVGFWLVPRFSSRVRSACDGKAGAETAARGSMVAMFGSVYWVRAVEGGC